ncbi:hypothetical protein BC833DRAFT_613557 [Globomyces pollinis-pini]|nr:hypothetical protein BC833DRAFT_613557 [Globomyces pollinis-pini]
MNSKSDEIQNQLHLSNTNSPKNNQIDLPGQNQISTDTDVGECYIQNMKLEMQLKAANEKIEQLQFKLSQFNSTTQNCIDSNNLMSRPPIYPSSEQLSPRKHPSVYHSTNDGDEPSNTHTVYVQRIASLEAQITQSNKKIEELIQTNKAKVLQLREKYKLQKTEAAVKIFDLEQENKKLKMKLESIQLDPDRSLNEVLRRKLEPLESNSLKLELEAKKQQLDLKSKALKKFSEGLVTF